MISWDTTFLIRYLVKEDDPKQTETVYQNLLKEQKKARPVFIASIALCETVWVLRFSYKLEKRSIATVLKHLLDDPNFHFEDSALFQKALELYTSSKGDFSDYLIGLTAKETVQAQATHTFDKALKSCPLFEVH